MSFYSLSGQQVSQKNYYFSAMQSSSTLVSLLSFLAVVLKKYVVLKIFLKHSVYLNLGWGMFAYVPSTKYYVQRIIFSSDSKK